MCDEGDRVENREIVESRMQESSTVGITDGAVNINISNISNNQTP